MVSTAVRVWVSLCSSEAANGIAPSGVQEVRSEYARDFNWEKMRARGQWKPLACCRARRTGRRTVPFSSPRRVIHTLCCLCVSSERDFCVFGYGRHCCAGDDCESA